MRTLPQNLTLRRPNPEDAPAVLELQIASDVAEYGEPDSFLEDIEETWADIDLNQDAWLVFSEGKLVGYAALSSGRQFAIDLYTHPEEPARQSVAHYLLEQCEARARSQQENGTLVYIIPHVNSTSLQAAEAAGFAPKNYHFRMQVNMDALPPAPVFPEGVALRNMIPGQDDQMVYEFIQTAFERPGRTRQPFESWHAAMMETESFNQDLWFLAFHGEELVGAILSFEYPQYGWVRQLGTLASWRKRGMGAALLQHMFRLFYERGHQVVALGVDGDNPNAKHFYLGIGMTCTRQFDSYQKTWGEPEK